MKECLTYDDIQLVPKYSELNHRSDCSLFSKITKTRNLRIPIVSSPMDTVTEYDMAFGMWNFGGLGVIHRFMDIEHQSNIIKSLIKNIEVEQRTVENLDISDELKDWFSDPPLCAAIGVTNDYFERAQELVNNGCNILLIDVAHGHHKLVKDAIGRLKNGIRGDVEIIGGSIATKEAARDLCEWGADGLRIGIGGGCFTPCMEVLTDNGLKRIIDIELNDMVYTHTGKLKPVINKLEFDRDEEIIEINDIECTKNHEFYVIHKKYKDIVDDDNLDKYAEWIEADNLTDDYFLVEIS